MGCVNKEEHQGSTTPEVIQLFPCEHTAISKAWGFFPEPAVLTHCCSRPCHGICRKAGTQAVSPREGTSLFWMALLCSAQLWQHMLGVQSQRRTGCCPGMLWAASSLLGSKEMVKWNVPGREGEQSWAVMGTAVIRGTEERQKGMKGCVKCQKDRKGRGQNAEERPVAAPRAISYLK